MKLIPGFMPKISHPRRPIETNVTRKFTIVNEIVFLIDSANVLKDLMLRLEALNRVVFLLMLRVVAVNHVKVQVFKELR